MGQIQSAVGLITGIPIQDTVDQLMAVSARPRNQLASRNEVLESERLAVNQLASLVLAMQFEANKLKSSSLYNARTVTSSDSTALAAKASPGATPAVGNYLLTPARTASSQQFLSQRFDADQLLGEGSFTFRVGGFVDKGILLDDLNGGAGFQRGQIRITDRSGASDVVDLSFAQSVDDVLEAINGNTTLNVTAEAVGDTFRLTDNTGQSVSNLIVQEVAGGTTAASLGLAGISETVDTATGSDIFTLHAGTRLSTLNDGNGLQIKDEVDDLEITLADGSTLSVDLSGSSTLGDVLDSLNAADPAKLTAAISTDGNRLELSDLTSGGGAFAVTSVGAGTASEDLGLATAAAGGTIAGSRLVSGLKDVLVSSLKGGQGLGTLGQIDVTNRDNVSFSVDLSGAETLGEIVAAFNAQATDVEASINDARSGILLTDTTGGSASNLIVADGDANETATALGLAADLAATSISGGSLGRQIVSESTRLDSLNGGAGVAPSDLLITDSSGATAALDLNADGAAAETIGDVLAAINSAGIGVQARINDKGDGILLIDTAGGSETLNVQEVGSGKLAAGLGILGDAVEVDIDGTPTQVIDGTSTVTVEIGAEDTLADVVETINGLDAGVTAGVLNDGVGLRLSLSVSATGSASALQLDTSASALSLQQTSAARDALLLYGSADVPGAGVLISSANNQFEQVVDGLDITIKNGTLEPVVLSVASTDASLVDTAENFVAAFNSVRSAIDELTIFNEEDFSTGILFGASEVLRVESDLARLLSGRLSGVGEFQSLDEIGISLDGEGKLELDSAKLQAAFESDPESLQRLFTEDDLGLVDKLDALVDRLAGNEDSLLTTRDGVLGDKIETNTERIESMTDRLARERERLLLHFFQLESTVARMQKNLTALSSLQSVPPLTSSRSNSNQ